MGISPEHRRSVLDIVRPWRGLFVAAGVAAALGATPARASAQTEVDRLLVRVNGSVITSSDVRQARALKLVPDTSSDASTQRGLENRVLMIAEAGRSASPAIVSDADVAERRKAWEASLGGDAATLLSTHGMNEGGLTAWLRDDLRVEQFLRQQFGAPGDPNREKAEAQWLERLRQRAGLR
jgi:hypothetical protein